MKNFLQTELRPPKKSKTKVAMFNFLLIICCTFGQIQDSVASTKVSVNLKNVSLEALFNVIERRTDYSFVYNTDEVENVKHKNYNFNNEDVEEIVRRCLNDEKLNYTLEDKHFIISGRTAFQQQSQLHKVTGIVKDKGGKPIPGVTIRIKDAMVGVTTNELGKYELSFSSATKQILVFSFIGMKTKEITYNGQPSINIVLEEDIAELDDVVVTGIYTRKKESFTGSAATYTTEELKATGTQNVLQSLKTMDPSFAIIDDNQFGSDPNRLPNMEIRGKSSMLGVRDELDADPNQPLFILDGFESTLAAINDLDINRVESITILKDAASTAIYGSKAANGVVVVETVKPQQGRLQVSYNGNMNVSMPDLSSYNLMNSKEKLEFERLAGKYVPSSWSVANEVELNKLYNEKLSDIASGVDTYWLGEPVRVGVNHKHSLYVRGGEGDFLFGIGGGYNGNTGVMKNSKREIVSGNIDLIYRKTKFQFTNKFSLSSTKYTNPIVAFSEYANANPYYKKYNDDGIVDKWLENNDFVRASNPMYNDRLNSRDEGNNLSITDYFIAEYFPLDGLKLRARVGLTYGNDDTENYKSRDDTQYDDVEITQKGYYSTTNSRKNQQEGELSATYAKVFNTHMINLVAGGNLYNSKVLTQGYAVQGFPEGDFTYPSFSNGYPENSSPTYYESISRSVNFYLNGGYSFNDRYLLDANIRYSGSSVYGTSKKYNTTWSLGLAWNMHKEKFISDNFEWINYLKFRASIGNPGNQSYESAQTLLVYSFQYESLNYFGMGASLSQIGNPDLKWQTTTDKNIGFDMTFLDKRLTINFDYYFKDTDPLLIKIGTPSSSGVSTWLTNAGKQKSSGMTASVSYFIIKDLAKRFSWMVRGNIRTQKYELNGIGNKLTMLNSSGKGANTVRYYDGSDPDNIWAVKSAGIDPSNGKELFYDKNGNYTYDYSYDNEVICGNTRPDIEGVLGTSLNYKGFSLSMNFRYQMGADVFNNALYSKVENISISGLSKNQDKRALYERWKQPGDIAKYKNIASAASTPMSSRFVQRENVFTMESLYIGYEFLDGWVKKLNLSSLKVQFSMRDVFRASTIKSERGISYPFARTMEAGLSFNF